MAYKTSARPARRRRQRTHEEIRTAKIKGTHARTSAADKRADKLASFYEHIIPPATREELQFRHGHWQARRDRVRAALAAAGSNAFVLNRFDECGSGCIVEWSETAQRHRLRADYCHNRHCQPCARAKANQIARNLREKIGEARQRQYRFITLTLKHSDAPLCDQVRRLYTCFRKLRKSKLWKQSQDGGAFMLEIKHNGHSWHPHLHVISDGRYMRKEDLSAEWHKATGDSFIADIRALPEPKDAVHYVCKYLHKGANDEVWQTRETAVEFVIATRGIRACSTYGTWRGFNLLARSTDASDWKPVAKLSELWQRARDGDQNSWCILKLLRAGDTDPEVD